MRRKIFLISIFIFLFFTLSYSRKDKEGYKALKPLMEVYSIVQESYIDEEKADPERLMESAINGMISSLDPFSQYLDPQSYKDMNEDTKAEFGGLGIEITIKDGQLTVVAPIEDTPAYKAGVKAGDKIMMIDGESTEGIDIMDAVHKLRGTPGTKVTITIQRGNNPDWKDITIVRDIIKIKNVRYYILGNKVGYIRISEFMGNASEVVEKALKLFKKKGIRKLIIDLRNNPGGLLNQAVDIADLFLEKDKLIVYTEGRDKTKRVNFKSEKNRLYKGHIVILINKGSASASEILAGCLQDYKKAILIGEKSFGKGSVQTIIPLSNKGALRLTTAQYFTPNGRKIHGVGLTPDITLEEQVPSSYTVKLKEKNYFEKFAAYYLKRKKEEKKEKEKIKKEKEQEENGKESEDKNNKEKGVKVSESDIKVFFKKSKDEKLLNDFKKFLKNKGEEVKIQEIAEDKDIILNWIKTEIAKKQKGRRYARKVSIENDSQVKRAIDILNTLYKYIPIK